MTIVMALLGKCSLNQNALTVVEFVLDDLSDPVREGLLLWLKLPIEIANGNGLVARGRFLSTD